MYYPLVVCTLFQVKWFQMRGHLLRLISSVEFQSGPLPQGVIINPNKGLFGLNTDWVSTDIPGLYSECNE